MNDPYTHYNTRYNNTGYHKVQIAVLQDIHGGLPGTPDEQDAWLASEPTNTILNAVTDAALEISGVEYPQSALRSLVLLLLQHKLSDETIYTIADHLRVFEDPADTRADDFVATIAAISQANNAEPSLFEAIRSASEIHSSPGRCAYHLLTAAHTLTETAMILLKEGETGYMSEKWTRSRKHLELAQSEWAK